MKLFKDKYTVSPEDHTRGRGGFNGEWFDSPGITDTEFDTAELACAAIEKRFTRHGWSRVHSCNQTAAAIYANPGRGRFLVVNWSLGDRIET